MIRKHNFIPMEYVNDLVRSDLRRGIPTIILLLAANILAFQYLKFQINEVDKADSKSVFNVSEVQAVERVIPSMGIFDLRRKISSLLRGMEIRSFNYENEKLNLEVQSESQRQCIEFVKAIEEGSSFELVSLSPIEKVDKFYRLKVELISIWR